MSSWLDRSCCRLLSGEACGILSPDLGYSRGIGRVLGGLNGVIKGSQVVLKGSILGNRGLKDHPGDPEAPHGSCIK
eukprot:6487654-Amphidinium_carterae.1